MPDRAAANLAALIESTEDLIGSVDLNFRLIAFNQALLRTIAKNRGTQVALGKRMEDLLPPEYAALMNSHFQRALSEGPFRTEATTIDGRVIEFAFNPIVAGGKNSGVSVFGKDISERSQAAANLGALIESTSDFIWSVDRNYRLITFNGELKRTFEASFGITPAVGMLPNDLLPPERAAVFPGLYERALAEGPFRTEYTTLDGRTVEMVLNPIVVRGEKTGISVFGKDVTEQKAAEKALLEAEKKYRAIFDGALEGIFQTSIEGKLLTANPAVAQMLGYDSQDYSTAEGRDVIQEAWVDRSERSKFLRLLEEKGVLRGYECRFKRKDGSFIWVSLNARRTYGAGSTTPINEGFIEDITERKQALNALREREARLREAEHLAVAGSFSWDVDSDTTTWSEGLFSITGRDPNDDAPNRAERERLYTPESWARLDAALKRALATGEPYDLELQIVRPDGALRWTRAQGRAIRNELGRVYRLFGTLQDTTEQKLAETKLRESEARYRTVFQASLDGMAISRRNDDRYVAVNDAFLDTVGYVREEVIGRTALELGLWVHPDHRQKLVEALRRDSNIRDEEIQFRKRRREIVWVRMSVSIIEIDGLSCLLTVMRDVSIARAAALRLASAQEALQISEERYRTVFQTSLDPVCITRLSDGEFVDANRAFLEVMGYARDEVIGRSTIALGIWADLHERQNMVGVLRENSAFRDIQARFRKKSGEIFWVMLSASMIEIEGITCLLGVFRDLSDAKAAEDKIQLLAFYDQLTRLPNRRLLLERLETVPYTGAGNPQERALLLLDLDEFKKLNDTRGHQTGDLLLKEAARRLTACVRGADTVARCGGEEFGVLLESFGKIPEPAAVHAQLVAGKIVAALGQPFSLAGQEYHCHCSIGITVFGDEPGSPHQVLQQAELALHHAKTEGRNAVRFFAPHLQSAADARAAIEQDLHQAIGRKQFLLYYQPQVDSTGLIGAEALVRWNHPERGLLDPGEFIPVAEEMGLIFPLGEWILEAACMQIAAWVNRPETANIALAVNISARQFRRPEFVDQVLAVLYRTGANPQSLKLELTESMLLEDVEDVIVKMSALKSYGLRFSLDDFGTGYSSLSYLKRLPLDQLKIDRAFVHDILGDVTSGAIAQTIISLSRTMGLSVIAEGVETEEQRGFLAHLGCDAFQGYLFGRPLPIEEFERSWLGSA